MNPISFGKLPPSPTHLKLRDLPPDQAYLKAHSLLTDGKKELDRERVDDPMIVPVQQAFAAAALDRTCGVGMWAHENGDTVLRDKALNQALALNELVYA